MLIDPSIRDYVLLPLLVFVVITTYLRMYIFRIMTPATGPNQSLAAMTERERAASILESQQKSLIARSARLRANGGYITPAGFTMRQQWLLADTPGRLNDPDLKDKAPNPMASFDMMKMQLVGQATYLGTFYLIQNALAGFLVLKLPFALTERFKQLTQQGIGLAALDTSYVSSGSWYMIAQFGIQRVLQLFASNDLLDDSKLMAMQMGPMAGAVGQQGPVWAVKSAFKAEASALGLVTYNSLLMDSEAQLLAAARARARL